MLAAVGSVESAEASFTMWDMSRLVNESSALVAAFDAGVEGLLDRLDRNDAGSAEFLRLWDGLMVEHGHRAPNEWDARPDSWTTRADIPLRMIDRLRHQTDDRSPHVAKAAAALERERLTTELLDVVAGDAEAHGTLAAGLSAAANWFGWREQGKYACIRLIHEVKLAMYELGGRMVAAGAIADKRHVFNLLDAELDEFLVDPAKFSATIAEREKAFQHLHTVDPPYIVGNGRGDEAIDTWPKRNSADIPKAKVGDVLQGGPGCPRRDHWAGTDRAGPDGRARDGHHRHPGRAHHRSGVGAAVPLGRVAWSSTSGQLAATQQSSAANSGVPCAMSVIQATARIPEGALITVDGSTGSVTIIG